MSENLKAIIVGAGRAGADLHLKAYLQIPDVEVVGICDPDLDRASEIAGKYGIRHAFPSLENALAAQPVDVVSICSPPKTHFELAQLAIANGSHLLVEKPIFETMREARHVEEVTSRKGLRFTAVHNKMYHPGLQAAMSEMRLGELGEPVQIHSVWMINGEKNRMTSDPNFWCHKLPGGRWEEMIPHPIYQAYQFMGPLRFRHLEMKNVTHRWPWLPAEEVEIILEGRTGYVSVKLSVNVEKYNFMLVYGSKKVLYVDSRRALDLLTHVNSSVSVRPRDLLSRALHRSAKLVRLSGRKRSGNRDKGKGGHLRLIEDFLAYVRDGEKDPPVSWEEALNTLEVTLEVGREIESRKHSPRI